MSDDTKQCLIIATAVAFVVGSVIWGIPVSTMVGRVQMELSFRASVQNGADPMRARCAVGEGQAATCAILAAK